MGDTATQTSPVTVTNIMPVMTSTTTKERMPSPDAISRNKSCRGIEDLDYKSSNCSFTDAAGEEVEDVLAMEDVHKRCREVISEKKYNCVPQNNYGILLALSHVCLSQSWSTT
ncbi:hypothetical protein LSH36_496g01031 [Paralvinella palmiformis]|uniref:Uncharacterized protein n=1 Tax=Paralvinella palmiformis TaxID=53620 RepID=A0AAD9J8X7_9ANNE|nr:hypothetical protein LSH36_496g01031 [Paralvinella palmiformis]